MKPFLYLDNWNTPRPRNRLEQLLDDGQWPVHCVKVQSEALPESVAYCGAFVGPSDSAAYGQDGWIAEERHLLQRLARAGVPLLGLCFGSQMLAAALFGLDVVRRRRERESGFGAVERAAAAAGDPLLAGLPERLDVFHWHGDEVVSGHPEMEILATSPACDTQVWRWRDHPAWGVQPHPEYDRAGFCAWLSQDAPQFRAAGLDPDAAASLSGDCLPAGGVFTNYLRIVTDHAAAGGRAGGVP